MATIHESMEAGFTYCDALEAAFEAKDAKEFKKWLELQRNWLLVGLREIYAYDEADAPEFGHMPADEVEQLLKESNERRAAERPAKKRGRLVA